MALRKKRETSGVESQILRENQIPKISRWASIALTTAPKGAFDYVYPVYSIDILNTCLGTPSVNHISLICARKMIEIGIMMYLVRVAHQNSLKGSQCIVKKVNNVYSGTGHIEELSKIVLFDDEKITNIIGALTFFGKNNDSFFMKNTELIVSYREVYKTDENNKVLFKQTLPCVILSDIIDLSKTNYIKIINSESLKEITAYREYDWFFETGKAKVSAIVFNLYSTTKIKENDKLNVDFFAKQLFYRNTGTNISENVYCSMNKTSIH